MIWNAPENCVTPFACVEADLLDPSVDVTIGYGGGRLVGDSGTINIAATLPEGERLAGFPTELQARADNARETGEPSMARRSPVPRAPIAVNDRRCTRR